MLADVNPVDHALPDRPYVIGSLVGTVDGRGTLGGTTAALGDAADRAIFRGLRGTVDAILVGTGTLRDEKYGRAGRSAALRKVRADRGLAEEPTIMVVSRSLSLPVDVPLLADRASLVRLYTPNSGPVPTMGASVAVRRLGANERTLTDVLRIARTEHRIRAIDCEGGPTLLAALAAEDLIDELFLTVSPFLAGPAERSLLGPWSPSSVLELELMSVLRRGSRLFLRYARRRREGGTPPARR